MEFINRTGQFYEKPARSNKYNIEFVQDIPILEISEYNKTRLQQLHEMRLREGITDDYIEKYAKVYADIIVPLSTLVE